MNISLHFVKRLIFATLLLSTVSNLLGQTGPNYVRIDVLKNTSHQSVIPYGTIVTPIELPNHGSTNINLFDTPPNFTYTPFNNYVGLDTFIFQFKKSQYVELVNFQVEVHESLVFAKKDFVLGNVDSAIHNIQVLNNDSTSAGSLKIRGVPIASSGSVAVSSDSSSLSFTPNTGFEGVASILYTACDTLGACDQGLLTVRIADYQPNYQDTFYFQNNINTSLPITLPDTSFVVGTGPENGNVSVRNNFTFNYKPDTDFYGLDSITFEVPADNSEVLVYIEVINTPGPNKFAIEDYGYLLTNQDSVEIDVLANDIQNGILFINSINIVDPPTNGSAIVDNVTGIVTYFPNQGFQGSDKFVYEVSNIFGDTEEAPIYAIVSNHEPLKATFDLSTPINTPIVLNYEIPISGFDFNIIDDPNFGTLDYYPGDTSLQINGQTVSGYNLLVYTPDQDFISEVLPDDIDLFEIEYCIGGNCPRVKFNITVEDRIGQPFCIGKECVWPGDTNNDGIVDIRDALPIGLFMGEDGNQRSNASTDYFGQYSNDWWNLNYGPLDPKYADSDGNGFIDIQDTASISTYFYRSNNISPKEVPVSKPLLDFEILNEDPPLAGDLVEIAIFLGNEANPAFNTYGLSFHMNYNTDLIIDSTMRVDWLQDSWLTQYSPVFEMNHRPYDGRVDIAGSRSNGVAVSGYGQVAVMSFIIEEDLAGGRFGEQGLIPITLSSGHSMNGYGNYARLNDLIINVPYSLEEAEEAEFTANDVITFPNPAGDYIFFHLNGENKLENIVLYNMAGQQVFSTSANDDKQVRLNVSNLQSGMYVAQVITEKGVVSKKIQIIRY